MRTDPFTDTWMFLIGQQPDQIALGAWQAGAVTNADLGFETLRRAQAAPAPFQLQGQVQCRGPRGQGQSLHIPTDPRGHLMLLAGAIWMSLGIFVMRKMINFKF